jgi:excinuclease ABC subunit C
VPTEPESLGAIESWLSEIRGTAVHVRVPHRGDKRELHATVSHNAEQELKRHSMRRATDHDSRTRALTELQVALRLPQVPLRIECYDMAHLHGTDYVGSMVVLEDGLPSKKEYRRFKIKDVAGNDDYAAMREVLTRRLSAYVKERDMPVSERGTTPGRFAYAPQLLLVDGGKGQLSVAIDVVQSLGLADEIPVASLAKQFEQVFIPGLDTPVVLGRTSDALFMLQVIRDEAHRFANTFHRELRGKRMKEGSLDGVSGLGDGRRKRLLKELGGVPGVKSASLDQLRALSWLPESVAIAVFEHLHR